MKTFDGTSTTDSRWGFGSFCVLAVAFLMCGALASPWATQPTEVAQDSSSLLSVYLGESFGSTSLQGASGPRILRSSDILVNPVALAQINPHRAGFRDVGELPIAHMQLLSDLAIDVEFLNVVPRWTMTEAAHGAVGELQEDGFIIRGRILEPHSGYVVLRARTERVFGSISVDGIGRIGLWGDENVFHTTNLLEYEDIIPSDDVGALVQEIAGKGVDVTPGGSVTMPTGCPGGCDDGCTIDVMTLYTLGARAYWANQDPPQDIRDVIECRIHEVNAIVDQSEIMPAGENLFRIVYLGMFKDDDDEHYDESGVSSGQVLSDLRNFDRTKRIRDNVRADLVTLWRSGSGGGLAWLPKQLSLATEPLGFSLVGAGAGAQTVAHELGHNLGCHHDRFIECGVCCPDGPHPCDSDCQCCVDGSCHTPCDVGCLCHPGTYYDFSVGWHFEAPESGKETDQYRTVLAYAMPCCSSPGQPATRIDYYSNPDVLFKGVPTGNACEDPKKCCSTDLAPANNALTIRGDEDHYGFRFLIAQHRTSESTSDTTSMIKARENAPPDFSTFALNGNSSAATMSWNGRYTAFATLADNLPGLTFQNPSDRQVILYDRETGLLQLVSSASGAGGTGGNGDSRAPAISGDGRILAFTSNATNLSSPPIPRSEQHVWATLQGLRPEVISRASGEAGQLGNDQSGVAAVSGDGRFVAFESVASNLTPEGGNGRFQIYLRDVETHETVCVSLNTKGEVANELSQTPAITHVPGEDPNDGEVIVAFTSFADDLVDDDSGLYGDIFVHVRGETISTERITKAFDGVSEANGDSHEPSISEDGNLIAFFSGATNLVDPEIEIGPHPFNVYVYDRTAEETTMVSICPSGEKAGNGPSISPRISPDGRFVAFVSYASNLHHDADCDAPQVQTGGQVFVRDLVEEVTYLVSKNDNGDMADAGSWEPAITRFGQAVAFTSSGTNLADSTAWQNVFIRDRGQFPCGDLNGDGVVDQEDLAIMLLHLSDNYECSVADLTGSGSVDEDDLDILLEAMQGPPQRCAHYLD